MNDLHFVVAKSGHHIEYVTSNANVRCCDASFERIPMENEIRENCKIKSTKNKCYNLSVDRINHMKQLLFQDRSFNTFWYQPAVRL